LGGDEVHQKGCQKYQGSYQKSVKEQPGEHQIRGFLKLKTINQSSQQYQISFLTLLTPHTSKTEHNPLIKQKSTKTTKSCAQTGKKIPNYPETEIISTLTLFLIEIPIINFNKNCIKIKQQITSNSRQQN
jgi:hypothetical protein